MKKVGIYGWGVVAPKTPDIDAFERNLEGSETWLEPFGGFGPDPFLVGRPEFDFERYRPWIDARFSPRRYSQLNSKMDLTTLYAVGSFIQALGQNPGVEEVLTELGTAAHVYIGTGLGALPTQFDASVELHKAQRDWDRFWTHPDRNEDYRAWQEDPEGRSADHSELPVDPATVEDPDAAADARVAWYAYWAPRSTDLARFLDELSEIEALPVMGDDVESSKLKAIRDRERKKSKLLEKWGVPSPPWTRVSTNFLWNIPNTPASQVSMMGRITGLSMAPVAACSTFGVCLKLGMDAIRRGEAKAVVVGATDPPPHPLTVGAFYSARVLAAGRDVSKPLTGLRGTHVSGGAALWILGDREFMEEKGFRPLGMEPVSVGVSSDADHIITPSTEGPEAAIRQALEGAGSKPADMASWDLHATATPGDYMEVENLRRILDPSVLVTARKGTFGHGMSAGGGWELTAQYLGAARGVLHPTPLARTELNAGIGEIHRAFVFDEACPLPDGSPVGKLSMGVGGVNACVVSKPLSDGSSPGS
ncbi:MAG: beta-ketoacyl synthase [Gemmatimonadales bacterium]|nr:MAG: beta-ketoacyl synthase [Gemmatimonadales bacterium]